MSFIDRTPALAALNYLKGQALSRLRLRGHHSGSTALAMRLDEAVAYVRSVVDDYVTYGALGDGERLRGKDVLEVGPGDNLGVALCLLARGANSVTCVDGFAPAHDSGHNAKLYAAIYNSLTEEEKGRVRDVVTLHPDGTATLGGDRLISRYHFPVDAQISPLESNRYDIVVSRAVLEHLLDLDAGWRTMVRSLRPAGEMWHKVDFRCHNFFGQIHPLYFLTVPDTLWNLISRPDPTLNRLRLPSYRELAAKDFQNVRIMFSHVMGEGEIQPHVEELEPERHHSRRHLESVESIRPRLQPPFRAYSAQDLLVTGIFLTVSGRRS